MFISHQSLQLTSEMDGHTGCQCKEKQTGKKGNYSPSCNMLFVVGNAAWHSVAEMCKTQLEMFTRKLVNLKKLMFSLLRPDSWPKWPPETLSSLNDLMIL